MMNAELMSVVCPDSFKESLPKSIGLYQDPRIYPVVAGDRLQNRGWVRTPLIF